MNRMIMKKPGKQGKSSDIVDEYGEILSKVLAYGSRNAVDIAILLQRLSYGLKEGAEEGRWKALAAFSLLITQLKYDLTLEVISPESWFKLRITDYEKMQDEIRREINFIIDELGLSKEFRV